MQPSTRLMVRILSMPASVLRVAHRPAPHVGFSGWQAVARCHISALAKPRVNPSGEASGIEADAPDDGAPSRPGVRALSERVKKTVAYTQAYKCAGCDCLLPPTHEVDHIVPVALGGHNGMGNLQALCRTCHTQKTRDQRHVRTWPGAS